MAQIPDKESQKKMIGELLRNADRFIKAAEWNKAFEEVNKALAIEPNNMYAMAYKDRINVSLAEEKKKAEEEKVKKLSDDKKGGEKPADQKGEKSKEPEKPAEEVRKESAPTEPKPPAKEEISAKGKDDSSVRIEALRQEFTAAQAKLQRDVAQLTMQLKETQALKESVEKKLNEQLADLQKELAAAKQSGTQSGSAAQDTAKKEIEALKEKHKKELERAKELTSAESIAQIAILQKEVESAKKQSDSSAVEKQGEEILRYVFDQAWKDGSLSNEKRAVLEAVKFALKISDAKFSELEKTTKSETYLNALRTVWHDGAVSTEESDYLQSLRDKLGLPAEEHFKLENQVRKELKK
ncbi:MAG: hypothetical protein WCT99_03545 [Bacteroidota bacterium]|jgi:hypothetical protein